MYTISDTTDADFDAVVADVTDALEDEGFGVMCDINVREKLEGHLDISFPKYRILGACNPELAHEAIKAERGIGALLPCNIVVYETDDGTIGVSAINPTELLTLADNPDLDSVGEDATERYERVIQTVVEG